MGHQKFSLNQLKKFLKQDADIHLFDCLDSTNTKTKMIAQDGGAEGELVIALSQTGASGEGFNKIEWGCKKQMLYKL